MRDIWNPWHGCIKYSEGCQNCYMYALDNRRGVERPSSDIYKTNNFNYPLKKDRNGNYKLRPGERIRANMTSDTFLEQADEWRNEFWKIIKTRSDLEFWLLTKRVPRIEQCLPADWGSGYPNVFLNITCENQRAFDERWPIFEKIPAAAKGICCAPLLSMIDLTPALKSGQISEISVGGENYDNPRPCNYDWVWLIHEQCRVYKTTFYWYETGTYLVRDGKTAYIPYKHDQSTIAGAARLNLVFPRSHDGIVLKDPVTHEILDKTKLRRPMYNPLHCLNCGNRGMCNGCDPDCKQRDKSFKMATAEEMDALEAAWKEQYNMK